MICVGLDLSLTASGMVAVGHDGAVLMAKTFGYGLKRTSSNEQKIKRLLHLAGEVCSFIGDVRAQYSQGSVPSVVIEGYAYGARGSQNDLAELQGVIKTQVYLSFSAVPEIIPASQARKTVLGNGRLSKEEIIEGLKGLDIVFIDHNQADAYVVARAHQIESA